MMSKQQKSQKMELPKEIKVVDEDDIEDDDDDIEEIDFEETEQTKRKSKKKEYSCENAEEALEELNKIFQRLEHDIKYHKIVFKTYQKLMQKKSKSGKKKSQNSDIHKEATGFIKAKIVPERFKLFYEKNLRNDPDFIIEFPDFDITQNQPRPVITKIIYYYIKKNKLYGKNEEGVINKREIIPDSSLTDLLKFKEGEDIIIFQNFQSYVSRLYSTIEEEVVVDIENKQVEEESELENNIKDQKKNKSKVAVSKN